MAQGKPIVFGDRYLSLALDDLTKNQLTDLVLDICYSELGENASHEAVLAWIQQRMEIVWRHRGDRQLDLQAIYSKRRAWWSEQLRRKAEAVMQ